jgi:hypothetical protein
MKASTHAATGRKNAASMDVLLFMTKGIKAMDEKRISALRPSTGVATGSRPDECQRVMTKSAWALIQAAYKNLMRKRMLSFLKKR